MFINNIENVAVIGAGDMGHGIAELCAMNGYNVYFIHTIFFPFPLFPI